MGTAYDREKQFKKDVEVIPERLASVEENVASVEAANANLEKSSMLRYNVTFYGITPANSSEVNGNALDSLLTIIEGNGGGVVYFPGCMTSYRIDNVKKDASGNILFDSQGAVQKKHIIRSGNITIEGDGYQSQIERVGAAPMFYFCGKSIKHPDYSTADNQGQIGFQRLRIKSLQILSPKVEAIITVEAMHALRIENCDFYGRGIQLHLREQFDSKIISTDFNESGRSDEITETFTTDSIDYDSPSLTFSPSILLESSVKSYAQVGYETTGLTLEFTNQILFWGCRFESFYGGAVCSKGNGTNGIRFTDCKFETLMSAIPTFVFLDSFNANSIQNCYIDRASTSRYGDFSTVPVVFVAGEFVNNNIDMQLSTFNENPSTPFATDLIKINTPIEKFSGNKFKIHYMPFFSDGTKYLADGKYLINYTYPHQLHLNGNKVEALIPQQFGTQKVDFDPYPPITTAPTDGYHSKGETILFSVPDSEGYTAARCVIAGTPGTWVKTNTITNNLPIKMPIITDMPSGDDRNSVIFTSGLIDGSKRMACIGLTSGELLRIGKYAAPPTTGTWLQGDIIYNSAPVVGASVGWECVTAGTPGTWRSIGVISENIVLNYSGTATLAEIKAGKILIYPVTGKRIKVLRYFAKVAGNFTTGTSVILRDSNATPITVATMLTAALTDGAKISSEVTVANVTDGAGLLSPLTTSSSLVIPADATMAGGTSITFSIDYMYV